MIFAKQAKLLKSLIQSLQPSTSPSEGSERLSEGSESLVNRMTGLLKTLTQLDTLRYILGLLLLTVMYIYIYIYNNKPW